MLKGATGGAKYSGSRMKVTVCGSETSMGLRHVTLSPALIVRFWGVNESHRLPLPPTEMFESDAVALSKAKVKPKTPAAIMMLPPFNENNINPN